MEKIGKRCAAKSTELPKELLSTVTLTTHLLPQTKAKTRSSHREHPPDYHNNAVDTATAATTIKIAAVNNSYNSYIRGNYDDNNKSWSTPCTSTKSTTVITNKTTSFITSKNNKFILQQQHKQKSTSTAALNKGFGDNTQICKITSTRTDTEETLPSLLTILPPATSEISSPAYRVSHHRKKNCNSNEYLLSTITLVLRQVIKLYKTATADPTLESKTSTYSKVASFSISTTKNTSAARSEAAAATSTCTKFRLLPSLGTTSFFTLLTFVCLETVLLSTVTNCAKTFYMHWNTSNSIFRIDNTDHIIDVNKGNLAFEFDQVHIICPVYEPGTYENETEKYIIYNVSKVEYETCRITNADPRVIAICDKPQKLMFFTITFRPFTPQPGGLEFLPGNDYYFISTSSKDDLYRRIGGRCSTNNMKVVFKVCCAPEEKNKTTITTGVGLSGGTAGGSGVDNSSGGGVGGEPINVDVNSPINVNHQHMNNINTIGINGVNTGLIPGGSINMNGGGGSGNNGIQLKPINGASGTSINTNIDQFNRIPIQTNGINVIGNNLGGGGDGLGSHGGSGIMLPPGGNAGINMIPTSVGGGGVGQYPGHPGQTGIRINNVASQQHHPSHKSNSNNNNNNGKDPVGVDGGGVFDYGFGDNQFLPPIINTNHSNIVQSTMNWPRWGNNKLNSNNINNQINVTFSNNDHENNNYSPSHRPTNNKKNKSK